MSGPTSDTAGKDGTDARPARTSHQRSKDAQEPMARDTIACAAEIMGGAERLATWAKKDDKNEEKFWTTLYPKLIPLQVTGEAGGPIRIAAAIEAARKRAAAGPQPVDSAPPSPSPASTSASGEES